MLRLKPKKKSNATFVSTTDVNGRKDNTTKLVDKTPHLYVVISNKHFINSAT